MTELRGFLGGLSFGAGLFAVLMWIGGGEIAGVTIERFSLGFGGLTLALLLFGSLTLRNVLR